MPIAPNPFECYYEETEHITYMHCLYNKNGVVIASDTRSAFYVPNEENPDIMDVKYDDNFTKIVHLKKANLLIGNSGQNTFDNVPFAEAMHNLEPKLVKQELHIVLEILRKFLEEQTLYSDVTLTVIKLNYHKNLPFYIQKMEISPREIPLTTTALAKGMLTWCNPYTKGCSSDNKEYHFNFVQEIYGQKDTTDNKHFPLNLDISDFSLQESIELALHLVQTHIDIAKFHSGLQPKSVGGKIHIFAIDNDCNITEYFIPQHSVNIAQYQK